ncbi:hypothetical protein C8Q75DRAFT_806515 [Abortiporus biennis]|nr:hypothetical protein C8Q75DRAFT_806515 [Abortiporus biennis]
MASLRSRLLQVAVPLVQSHGFTRQALANSALHLPTPHAEPLSETAVSSLFGEGDVARRTLIEAWLDNARNEMRSSASNNIKDILTTRLQQNEPVLRLLPEAFAVLASSNSLPVLDPRPALSHVAKVADDACRLSGAVETGTSWYTRRASLAAVYTAAELHQLTSPETAYSFLEDLLQKSETLGRSFDEVQLFASYVGNSWAGILRSRGIIS